MSFQTPSKQKSFTPAKSCTKSFGTPSRAAGVALLFAAGCVMDQSSNHHVSAFTSSSVPSSSSSFARSNNSNNNRKNNNRVFSSSSVKKMKAAHDYDGEDEMTGPFWFSGEPTVDDTSVQRLETIFQKPAPSSPSMAAATTASTTTTTTTSFPEIPMDLSEEYSLEDLDPEQPFFFSRDSSMDERLIRLKEIFETNEGTDDGADSGHQALDDFSWQ
eukprot:CAMPEP_0117031228 /NCGR_PEP_ID=MMETSP0472-20121206/22472_1 /TAXON_ID=693140 ORGANISM="Tiarina fusus, Strain LIS" /NCGR_SAMPLE_ID=MMETSP0472 /ASSEMBLY_ACC=CAM_ASM_000603 /LENGTH=215 /DNA_ID=CAMNT_0004739515 /DNA_START=74 /DNA_END=721 /DNA_ORIENTATION=-